VSDHYQTDDWIMRIFIDYYDPCPYNRIFDPKKHLDGLKLKWDEEVEDGWFDGEYNHEYHGIFINPPYSNPYPWVLKAIETKKNYPKINIVMLLKNDSSTKYYRKLHENNANFLFPYGRLKYNTGKSAPFSSVLVVL